MPDNAAACVLELVRSIKCVKVKSPQKPVERSAAEFLAELQEAIEDVKRPQRGKIERQSIEIDAEEQAEAQAR